MASSGTKCCITWCWIIQVLCWLSIVFFILSMIFDPVNLYTASLTTLLIIYVIYVISNMCSPTFAYLYHKHGSNSIHSYMQSMFYSAPTITWHVECYHYETRHHHHRDSKGNTRHTTSQHKVVTYSGSRDFRYYTWRDVSGLFLLDSHKIYKGENKVYIKLELNLNIDYADDITRIDYQRQKDDYYHENRWRDTHISFTEARNIKGFQQYNMVRISDQKPPGINWCVFLFFTFILPFAEFYKLYVDSFCIEQDYQVKKVVSTRYNLHEQEHAQQWIVRVPTLVIFNQPQVVFNEAPMPLHNEPVLPTMEDLDHAKNFQFSGNNHHPDNYTPHFQDNQQGGMMTAYSQPMQGGLPNNDNGNANRGGMMTNYTQPMTGNTGYNSSNVNAFDEPLLPNKDQVNLNVAGKK